MGINDFGQGYVYEYPSSDPLMDSSADSAVGQPGIARRQAPEDEEHAGHLREKAWLMTCFTIYYVLDTMTM